MDIKILVILLLIVIISVLSIYFTVRDTKKSSKENFDTLPSGKSYGILLADPDGNIYQTDLQTAINQTMTKAITFTNGVNFKDTAVINGDITFNGQGTFKNGLVSEANSTFNSGMTVKGVLKGEDIYGTSALRTNSITKLTADGQNGAEMITFSPSTKTVTLPQGFIDTNYISTRGIYSNPNYNDMMFQFGQNADYIFYGRSLNKQSPNNTLWVEDPTK
jgi:hypothetical protein